MLGVIQSANVTSTLGAICARTAIVAAAASVIGTMMNASLREEDVMLILSFVRILAPMVGFLLVLPLIGVAYREGPAANVTGGFGEPSCHECHFDQPLNDASGRLSLGGVPDQYRGRQPYRITVTLERPGVTRAGFEISARFASGEQRGRQAGSWRALDDRVQIIRSETDAALLFVQHNGAGSVPANPGSASWTMEWAAPDSAMDDVQFNVAANAANDDASPLGDYIYVQDARSTPD